MGWLLWIYAWVISCVVLRTLATSGRKRVGLTSEAQWEGWSEAEGPKDNTACGNRIPAYPITPNRRGCSQVLSASGHPIDPKRSGRPQVLLTFGHPISWQPKKAISSLVDFRPLQSAGNRRGCSQVLSTSGSSNQLATGEGDLRSCRLPVSQSGIKEEGDLKSFDFWSPH